MKNVMLILCCFISVTAAAQFPYFDAPGLVLRGIEKTTADGAKKATDKTNKAYNKTISVSGIELFARNPLDIPLTYINFDSYNGTCSLYINPYKKAQCRDKVSYLRKAYDIVYQLMLSRTAFEVNQGIKEQIGEKYVSISTTILGELNRVKRKAEKDNAFIKFIKN